MIRTHGDYHLGQTMLADARLGGPRLRGRAGAAAARAAAQALAAARRRGDAALVLLRGGAARRLLRGAPRPRAGRSARARRSWTATSRPSTAALLPPGERGARASCWRSSSSRRPSTSCATSSTTDPTGSRSRSPGIAPAARIDDASDQLIARQHATRTRILGAHPDDGGVVIRAFRPAAHDGRGRRGRRAARRARARCTPDGVFEGDDQGRRSCRSPTSSRSTTATAGTFTIDDPYRFLPTLGELDLHLRRRGPPRGALRAPRRARDRASTASPGTAFAVWAPARASVSVVGDFNCWDGRLHPMRSLGSERHLGAVRARASARARSYKYEILAPDGELRLKADPFAFETERAAQDRLGRPRARARVARTRSGCEARRKTHAARRADVDLRGPPRLVAAEPARGQPLADLPRAGRRARRPTRRTWASRTSSCCRSWHHPFTGSWGYQVTGYFAPDAALRLARRLPRVRRPPAPATASA